jgi:S1-C subfamily serine protease
MGTGSGFVIEGERILTNAHVVAFADEILIESDKLPRKVSARVESLAHGIDIAVLRVDEPGFFDLHPPVEMASALPNDQDEVTVFGYPMGGETMSTTVGVVSRVEYGEYWYSIEGIKIQVDAAINPGNSGGPAFSGNTCVGMVFSGFNEADNIGYAIPTMEIETFLEDVSDGEYTGKVQLDAYLVSSENPDRRRRLGLGMQDSGMMVLEAADETKLHRWDVVSEIDGVAIDDQGYGMVQGKRLRYPAIIENKAGNRTSIPLRVIRDGVPVSLRAGLTTELNERYLFPMRPEMDFEYFIHGPFVFMAADSGHARLASDSDWGPSLIRRMNPLATRCFDRKEFEDEQIVILATRSFPHKILRGHDRIELGTTLHSVDGVKVRNIAHARELIRNHDSEFIEFEFGDKFMDGVLTLDAKALASSTEDVLEKNSIRKSASPGLE